MPLKKWNILSAEPVFVNRWWNVLNEKVELPDGSTTEWWVNHQDGGVVVFALTEENTVVVNRQYKHGIREIVTELAIGRIDGEPGGPIVEAQRELLEETGYGGGDWEEIGSLVSNPTSSTARLHVFLARGVRKIAEQKQDVREMIETSEVPLAEFMSLVEGGAFSTQASLAASFLALRKIGALTFKV